MDLHGCDVIPAMDVDTERQTQGRIRPRRSPRGRVLRAPARPTRTPHRPDGEAASRPSSALAWPSSIQDPTADEAWGNGWHGGVEYRLDRYVHSAGAFRLQKVSVARGSRLGGEAESWTWRDKIGALYRQCALVPSTMGPPPPQVPRGSFAELGPTDYRGNVQLLGKHEHRWSRSYAPHSTIALRSGHHAPPAAATPAAGARGGRARTGASPRWCKQSSLRRRTSQRAKDNGSQCNLAMRLRTTHHPRSVAIRSSLLFRRCACGTSGGSVPWYLRRTAARGNARGTPKERGSFETAPRHRCSRSGLRRESLCLPARWYCALTRLHSIPKSRKLGSVACLASEPGALISVEDL